MENLLNKLRYLNEDEIRILSNIGVSDLSGLLNLSNNLLFVLFFGMEYLGVIEKIHESLNNDKTICTDEIVEDAPNINSDQPRESINNEVLEVSIDELGLSIRSENALKREGIWIIGDLISKTELELYSIRNLGRKSVREVLMKMDEFLVSVEHRNSDNRRNKSSKKEYKFVNQKFYQCSKNKALKMSEVIKTIQDFIMKNPSNNVNDLYAHLSIHFQVNSFNMRNLKLLLKELGAIGSYGSLRKFDLPKLSDKFLSPSGFSLVELRNIIESNLFKEMVDDYPFRTNWLTSFLNNLDSELLCNQDNFSEIYKYINWLDLPTVFEVREQLDSLMSNHKTERNIQIYKERVSIDSACKTLEKIATEFGITRERVRQIVSKISKSIMDLVLLINDDLLYEDQQKRISRAKIKKLLPKYSDEVLFAFIESKNYYVSKSKHDLIQEGIRDSYITPFLNNKYTTLTEEDFELILIKEIRRDNKEELTNRYYQHLYSNYRKVGDTYIFYKLNKYKQLEILIDYHFPNGIRLTDTGQMKQLLNYYFELNGKEFDSVSDRSIVARLADKLDLIDIGTYVSRRNLGKLSQVTINEIKRIVEIQLPKPVYYDFIYQELENRYKNLDNIKNYHHLHGLMKVYMSDEYHFHKAYVALERVKDHTLELELELLGLNRIVTSNDFKIRTTSKSNTSSLVLTYSNNWIHLGNERYLPTKLLDNETSILEKLKRQVINLLEEHEVINASLLETYISENIPKLKSDYGIDNRIAISNLLSHMNDGSWINQRTHLYKPHLSLSDRRDIAIFLIKKQSQIAINELFDRIKKIGGSVSYEYNILANLFPTYVRISKNYLMFSDNIHINELELAKLKEELERLLESNDGIILSTITDYRGFPTIELEWNDHLLASIIKLHFPEYRLLNTSFNYETLSYLLVHDDSNIVNVSQFM